MVEKEAGEVRREMHANTGDGVGGGSGRKCLFEMGRRSDVDNDTKYCCYY